ncbi:hypothetical protein CKO31_20400 [Thiohalocapsa halophila]|uniref:Uncharacterized protein n=1 Tax=Thiohalocapsa halophila TaxID=69359 RepID=A0ABS1CNX6_9GAMM|nr:hypothetical protein [Thiohalocapsa halophila]MBK1633071.1 hypothetical protein [Thiohalocapsa halophila]
MLYKEAWEIKAAEGRRPPSSTQLRARTEHSISAKVAASRLGRAEQRNQVEVSGPFGERGRARMFDPDPDPETECKIA